MILYIHGFLSCGLSTKSQALVDYFGDKQVLHPDLPTAPAEAIALLEHLIAQHPIDLLVGSSLGGYFATWLNRQRAIPTVLVNPAMVPHILLDDYLGEHTRCDGSTFVLTEQHLAHLRSYHREQLRGDEHYLVLLQSGDEVLDYRQAAAYYAAKEVVVEQGGNHRFEDFASHLPRIAAWRQQHAENQERTA